MNGLGFLTRYNLTRIALVVLLSPVWVPIFLFFMIMIPRSELDDWREARE